MDRRDPMLLQVWSQRVVPVVFRRKSKPLIVRIPTARDNIEWLQGEHRNPPDWQPRGKYWETPKSWFEDVIRRALQKYGRVYVIQPFTEQQKCAPACWNAVGVKCECSCMGANHGSGDPAGKWHIVSETFAVRWETREYSCRLLSAFNA
jgi:hypothetical protein